MASQTKIKFTSVVGLTSPTLIVFGLMLIVTVSGILWSAFALSDPTTLPIRKVVIEGEFRHLDPDDLRTVVTEAVDAGFFGVNVTEIREILLKEPWIQTATVRRVWPETLRVNISEQRPIARWGEHALLNERGEIFRPDVEQAPSNIVLLKGPAGTESEVLKHYRKLFVELGRLGLGIEAVTLSGRHAWTVETKDGRTLVLGRKKFEARLAQFIFGYTHGLDDDWKCINRVDLRYTNGFAVAATGANGRTC